MEQDHKADESMTAFPAHKLDHVPGLSVNARVIRFDPTRTTVLRNRFAQDMKSRFVKLKKVIVQAIVEKDCFGIENPAGFRVFFNPCHDEQGRFCSTGGGGGISRQLSKSEQKIAKLLTRSENIDFQSDQKLGENISKDLSRICRRYPMVKDSINGNHPLRDIELGSRLSHNEGGRSDVISGRIWISNNAKPGENFLSFGFGKPNVAGNSGPALFRHEIGHFVFENNSLKKQYDWHNLYESKTSDWWGSAVSKYAGTRAIEAFSECFAVFTHPGYGVGSVTPRLPRDIHNYFKELLGKKIKTNLSTLADPQAPAVKQFDFPRSQEKAAAFMEWLRKQEQAGILETETRPQIGVAIESAWTDRYIKDSYQRGVMRARDELRGRGYDVPPLEATGGIWGSLSQPPHIERLGVAYSRTFEGLKGITSAMDTQISHVLAMGLADGDNPRVLAKKLLATIDGNNAGTLGITDSLGRFIPAQRRAEMLARTEIIRSHHLGNVSELRQWAVTGVQVRAEWVTAGYKVCPECAKLQGRFFSLDEVQNMLPRHPNCRCCIIPVDMTGKKS